MGTQELTSPRAREGWASWPRLAGWLRAELAGLAHPALWAALAALLLVFLIVPQLPLRYGFDVGYEEGVGSDLPFLQGFNTAERDELGTYRWSADGATIVVPGVGTRELLVRLRWLPTPAAVAEVAPRTVALTAGGVSLGELPLRPEGATQLVVVPREAVAGGALQLTLRSDTFTLPGDPRSLGARLSDFEVVGLAGRLPRAPDWGAALAWVGAVALGWLAARAALAPARSSGDSRRSAQSAPSADGLARGVTRGETPAVLVLAAGALLVAAAALFDAPRWAFGAQAALVACGLAYPLALATRAALPALARRLRVPLDGTSLGWLGFFVVASFALRFGGRLYPASMHGDIGFHHNRFNEAVWGLIYIVSVNRGVEFPYPPGPYTLVAPFALLGLEIRVLLQLGAALFDAVSAALVYAIASRVAGQRVALLAAGTYVFTAATLMASWWSFDTHIYTQFLHLLLIATLLWAAEAWGAGPSRRQSDGMGGREGTRASGQAGTRAGVREGVSAVFLLLCLVFLGHFGFLINTALMLGLATTVVWVLSLRGVEWAGWVRWPLTLTLTGAVGVAAIFFYTAYIPMFLGQLETAREGGLTAVAGRGAVSRAVMWQRLWRDGLLVHFGLFPLLLMPWGLWLLWRGARREAGLGPRRVMLGLVLGSLAVAATFAVFPFVAGVTNSPRWMLFIAWVVAVGSALATADLWRRGWWGRVLALVMGAVVLANTAWVWLGPMLWRIRPPEPF